VAVRGKRTLERRPVLGKAPPGRSTVRHDYPDTDDARMPAPLARDVASETPVAIHLSDEAANITDCALDLDNEEGVVARMPGKDVDGAAFAEDRERDLRLDDPLRKGSQSSDERFRDAGVPRIEKPVEIRSVPTRNEIDSSIDGPEKATENRDARPVEMPSLDARHGRGRHAGNASERRLGHLPMASDRSDNESDLRIVH
jgi:hypothetical protein